MKQRSLPISGGFRFGNCGGLAARASLAGDSRVVRSRRGVTVVREHDAGADPRVEAEKLRQLVGEAVGDDVTAGVGGPKNGAAGAHFALMQSEHAVALGPGLHGYGRTI